MSYTQRLTEKELISPPSFLPSNMHYETMMGSIAYGLDSDNSDLDIYGFAIPPKNMVFPHLDGEIFGFGTQKRRFEQFQAHHVFDQDAKGGKGQEIDISVYNIVKYFHLCMENNPNMLDSLFSSTNSVLFITKIGTMVRDNRKIFLHKGSWHKFKGYSYSQLHKIDNKKPVGKRKELVEKYGFDIKFAYHVVRLLNECEMILTEGDLDITRNREQLKSIRRGEWSEKDIRDYFQQKELAMEKLYQESKLPHSPDENAIKQLLINCLEEHYGNLSSCVVNVDKATLCLQRVKRVIEEAGI
jgi:predicted nucleotidyltransferase